jgi:tryptophan synthase alpha chain
MGTVETTLTAVRDAGRPSLVTYVMAGVRADWTDVVAAMAAAGADAIEVGLPFSDPMLDGPVVAEAAAAALARGVTVPGLLREMPRAPVPLIAMTYANHLFSRGPGFLTQLAEAGLEGLILSDLPLNEARPYCARAAEAGLDAVLMIAPSTPPAQVREICTLSSGFVYLMSAMATTGKTATFDAGEVARTAREAGGPPVIAGFGVDTPERARAAAGHADGVAVGSVFMRQVLDGASVDEVAATVAGLRAALDRL